MANISVTRTSNDITVTKPNTSFEVTTPTQQVINIGNPSVSIDIATQPIDITITEVGITNTDQLIEGTSNLFFTNARARNAISLTTDDAAILSYNTGTGVFAWATPTTTKITEGTNLYFTNARADARADVRIAASSINALADVDTATTPPSANQVLGWNGSNWIPSTAASIGAVTSVNGDGGPAVVLDTDDIAEGVTNVYYTDTRFDNRLATKTTTNLSEGSNLYYTDARSRTAITVSDTGGDGSLSYDNGTGIITYTGPSATEVRAHFTAGTGVSISSGQISIGQAVGTTDNVQFNDLTVSGNLTVNGTTTQINTDVLNVEDNEITLNSNVVGSANLDASIIINRGSDTDVKLLWNENTNKWQFTNDGSTYYDFVTADTNTTYSISAETATGGANLRLTDSGAGTDDVKLNSGTGVTVSRTDANTIDIAIGQSVATTDSPQFLGASLGNITVGVATDNTITTTSGDLILTANTNKVTTTGTLEVNNGAFSVTSGFLDLTIGTAQLTANLLDTTATTVNAFGAATAVNIGAATGYTTIDNNIVKGAVRAPFLANNDVYGFGTAGTTGRGLGISVDNSADTSKRAIIVTRAYSGGTGTAPRNPIIGETARNTAASPYRLSANDNILEFLGNGYYDDLAGTANWSSANASALSPLIVRGRARETWTGQSNLGTEWQVLLMPGGGVVPAANNYVSNTFNPVGGNSFTSDSHTFSARNTAQGGSNFGNQLLVNDTGIQVYGNNIVASDGNTNITLTGNTLTAFAGDIKISGNDIQSSSGSTAITLSGTDITIAGDLAVNGDDITTNQTTFNLVNTTATTVNAFGAATTANVGNTAALSLVNVGNSVTFAANAYSGDIRNSNTLNNNDIWSFNNGAGGSYKGLSISNSTNTTDRAGIILRSYGVSGGAPRAGIITEIARGSAASPSALITGDLLVDLTGTGYNGTDWATDAVVNIPFAIQGITTENWNGTTNMGSAFRVRAQPANTNFTTGSLVNVIEHNPDSATYRSEAFTFRPKTGTTDLLTIDNSGNVAIAGDLRINGDDIKASDGNTNITLTSNTLTTFSGDIRINGNDIQASDGNTNITLTSNTLTTFAGDLQINGNDIKASDGATAITLEPVTSYDPNTQIVANLFKGDIRNATTESAGDVWQQGTAGYRGITVDNSQNTAKRPGYILRGYSGGASAPRSTFVGETARGTAASPVRLSTNDNMLEFFATGYYDNGSGSAGWMSDANVAPGMIMRARASENWLGASNMGTEFQILLTPTGVTQNAGGAAYNTSLILNPTAGNSYRSDSHTFITRSAGAGGTNTTQLTIDSSGNVVITGDLRINGNDIQASDGNTNITLTSNTLTTFAGDIKVAGNDIQASDGNTNITLNSNTLTTFAGDIRVNGGDIQNDSGDTTITMATGAGALTTFAGDIQINGDSVYDSTNKERIEFQIANDRIAYYGTRNQYYYADVANASTIYFNPGDKSGATQGERYTQFNMINRNTNSDTHSLFSMTTYNFNNGTGNYSATLADEIIGRIGATGQYGTGTSPQTNQSCADVEFRAAENFTASANGGRVVFKAVEIGTTNTLVDVIAVDTSNAYIRSDNFYFRDNGNTALTSANINYTRTYGEFAYTAGTITIAAQNTVYAFPLDTTLSSSGVTISNTSRININVSGHYKIIMSLQAAMETNTIGQFDFWLRKNGTDVANSATQVDLLKDQKSVVAMDWLVESDGNDYWEIVYASPDSDYADIDFPYIPAWTTPTNPYARPAAPPILVNVIPAGM